MSTKSIAAQRPFKLALIASILLIGAVISAPGFGANTTATSTAQVLIPISITKAADLAFGKFAAGTSLGSIAVDTAGARSASGVTVASSATTAARFNITGEPNATYSISHSGTTNLTNGTDTMALTLVSDLAGLGGTSGEVSAGNLGAGGTQSLYVGGTLAVAANQPAGAYTGSIAAAVEYN
jgi:spore coat protein U-like protein